MSWQQVCTTADLEPESALSVEVRAASGAVVPVCIARDCHGTWHAVGDICTHEDVNLSDGEVLIPQSNAPNTGRNSTCVPGVPSRSRRSHPCPSTP